MIELNDREAGQLRERLRQARTGRPASETMAVSANASTSVTFTATEKVAVLEVLARRVSEETLGPLSDGLSKLRSALAHELEPHS
jgi:hypothetical protein